MLNTTPTRSEREMYDSKTPPDDEDQDDRESRDADHCDEVLHERYDKEVKG